MRTCGDAGLQFRVSHYLGFRVRDKVRVSVRDRVGVRVSDGVIGLAHFTFCHTSSPQNPASSHARILPIATAWGGFITATYIHRVDAFVRRSKRCGFCSPDLPDFSEQLAEYDDRLFNRIHSNSQHVLYSLLPPLLLLPRTRTIICHPEVDSCLIMVAISLTVTLFIVY